MIFNPNEKLARRSKAIKTGQIKLCSKQLSFDDVFSVESATVWQLIFIVCGLHTTWESFFFVFVFIMRWQKVFVVASRLESVGDKV